MLYTDADAISIPDLQLLDPEIQAVANSAKINVGPIISLGCEEAGQRLLSQIQSVGSSFAASGDLSWNHMTAMQAGIVTGGNLTRVQLGQIVVTNPRPGSLSAVKLFVMYYTLELFYRAASNRVVANVDRFQQKRDDFRKSLANQYAPMLRAQGLPIVFNPLPCPSAIHEPNTGIWSVTASGAGSTAAAGNYDITITWVGANYVSPLKNKNQESGPSAIQTLALAANQYLHIDITGLNPPSTTPNNPIPYGYSGYALITPAVGWNVYACASGGIPKLLNATPIPVATKTYQGDPGAPLPYVVGTGQYPDQALPLISTIPRA